MCGVCMATKEAGLPQTMTGDAENWKCCFFKVLLNLEVIDF